MSEPTPKFAADKMLGRLATWLRLLGYDTLYGSHLSGRTLLRAARDEGRVVLTRDGRLRREREAPPLLFIDSDHFREQLRQVVATYGLDPYAHLLSRCARCNQPVQAVAKEAVLARVPAYVAATQSRFVQCPRCRRIYWHATHAERLRAELGRMGYRPPAASG